MTGQGSQGFPARMAGPARSSAMLTDLYELTMAAAYYDQGMAAPASFSLFIREYPPDRGYFVSAGLEDVLGFLEEFHFTQEDVDYLATTGLFAPDFLHYLAGLRFTGEVRAIPEGRIFFRDEPLLEVTGPIVEAQAVETFVINAVNFQTAVASKAARCVHAAGGRELVDFSLRRTHGADAGLKVARSCYLAGFLGTSNVLAGQIYGIPVSGTMAHSFITSFRDEAAAFRAFARVFPKDTVLLIDTYDTVAGARKAAEVAREMEERGEKLKGVRLDSGDMAELSKEVRRIFEQADLGAVSIFASGGFDEFKIADVLGRGAQIDAFGVGTKVGVSADAPYCDIAYKLVQYDGRPVLKLSTGKRTLAGEKQVYRAREEDRMVRDILSLRDELCSGEPLLERVMQGGRRSRPAEPLAAIRERFKDDFTALPEAQKALRCPEEYSVEISPGLRASQERVVHRVREKELGES